MSRSYLAVPLMILVAFCAATSTPSAHGQSGLRAGQRGLVSQSDAGRYGLHRAWFTQLSMGPSYGGVVGIHTHVSALDTRYSCEVIWGEGRGSRIFRSTDLDAFGQELGQERAKRRAQVLLDELTRLGETAEMRERGDTPVITLYAATNRGVVHSVDAETGRTHWVTTVGSSRHPTTEISANEKYLALMNGTVLYLLNREDGTVHWSRKTQGIPGAGPALSGTICFAPMFSGAVEAFDVEDPTAFVGHYRSTGRVVIQPIITPDKVLWPTDRGALYVGHSDQFGIVYRIEAERSLVSQPAYANELFYFTSVDSYLYAIHERDGRVAWTLALGEPLRQSPIVLEEYLYVVGDDGTLFCRDSLTGVGLWEFPGIRQFLAASSDRLYCIGLDDSLVILNRKSRALLGRIGARSLDFRVTNIVSDRIYLGTRSGMLQCFREVSSEFPQLHIDMDELLRRQTPVLGDAEEAEPEAEQVPRPPAAPSPSDDDPFGIPAAPADPDAPFGVPPAIDDPFGAPPADDDDPFGDPFN